MTPSDNFDILGGDGVLGLVYGFAEHERYQRFIMTFHVAIDDSGERNGGPAFVLAGFGARATDWMQFERKWSRALKDEGLTYFKMSEAWAFAEEFRFKRGWTQARREALFYRLSEIIRDHSYFAVYMTVPGDEYAKFLKGEFAHILDQPYVYVAQVLMAQVYDHLRSVNLTERVDFVFDTESDKTVEYMTRMFQRTIDVAPPEYASYVGEPPVFRNDKTFLPLQASDYFAWHIRRLKTAQVANELFSTPWLSPLGTLPLVRAHIDADDLDRFVRGLRVPGAVFPHDRKRAKHAKR